MDRRLGIDFGVGRIGLALGSVMAHEYRTLPYNDRTVESIAHIIDQEKIDTIVVGRPIRSQGESGTIEPELEQFIDALKKSIQGVSVVFSNEAFSSSEAELQLKELGLSASDMKKRVDQRAAMLILDQYNKEHPISVL